MYFAGLGAVKRSFSEELRMVQQTSDMMMSRKSFAKWFDNFGAASTDKTTF
jgi:hypothetical protein